MLGKLSKVLIFPIILLISINTLYVYVAISASDSLIINNEILNLFIHESGGRTYLSKPIIPITIKSNSIGIGKSQDFICTLKAGAKYHVYFYGDWINYDPKADKTDYDIFVYNPLGQLESMHTESAGQPEHLGTTVQEPFFIPLYSGDYKFQIKNDEKESKKSEAGTLMIIEHLDCNHWYDLHVNGKVNNVPIEDTYWAYEFVTTNEHVKVMIEVPDPPNTYLDMYEAQLYLMAYPDGGVGTILNGMPLPEEAFLYGGLSGIYGGYRLDAEGLSGINASASCEYYGQDMVIDYVFSKSTEESNPELPSEEMNQFLYHLALIGEEGEGTIRFMFKTDFNPPFLSILNPIESAYSNDDVNIVVNAQDNETGLQSVLLNYTVNNWQSWTALEMTSSGNNTYLGKIPSQSGGTTVKYKVTATDWAENVMSHGSSYVVKDRTDMTIALSKTVLVAGESVRVNGWISHGSVMVTLDFANQDVHILKTATANSTGYFSYYLILDKSGTYTVMASWSGNEQCFPGTSSSHTFIVEKNYTMLTCNVDVVSVTLGEEIDVYGFLSPTQRNSMVTVTFTKPDGTTIEREAYTSSDGSYEILAYKPDMKGEWRVQAAFEGDELQLSSSSTQLSFTVGDTWINEYKLYIIVSAGAAVTVVFAIILFSRGKGRLEEEE